MTSDTQFDEGDFVELDGKTGKVVTAVVTNQGSEYTVSFRDGSFEHAMEDELELAEMEGSEIVQNLDKSSRDNLQWLDMESADQDSLFNSYGQFVLLLDADESPLEEALSDASPKQLLKCISVFEDQLNDMMCDMKTNRELVQRFLYLRQFAIVEFRERLSVACEVQRMDYAPHEDRILLQYEDLNFDFEE